jgi:hypothetical protein
MAAEYRFDESAEASKSKKPWTDEEITRLVQLRSKHSGLTWGKFEQIYNSAVEPSLRRTQDGLSWKWNSLFAKKTYHRRRRDRKRSKIQQSRVPLIFQSEPDDAALQALTVSDMFLRVEFSD